MNLLFRGPLGRILFESNWCHPLKIKVIINLKRKSLQEIDWIHATLGKACLVPDIHVLPG